MKRDGGGLVVSVPEKFRSENEWVEFGKKLARTERGVGWLIGAWWNAGEPYGDRVERAKECGFKPAVCRVYGHVERNVLIRINTLSFLHHAKVAALPAPQQRTWLQRADKNEWSVMELRREMKRAAVREVDPVEGKYRVFYADPPWKYSDGLEIQTVAGGESYGPASAHYKPMSIDELCAMGIKDAAEDNAVLFLWVTAPLLEDAFTVIHAWGFAYKANFVWDKVKHNMGHYNSVRHEHLLVAVRGQCVPDERKLFDSVQSIERTEHSRKPEEFRKIIDALYTFGNKIELFGRGKQIEGWFKWGDQAHE